MKLVHIIISTILFISVEMFSIQRKLCKGSTNCRLQETLTEQCSDFDTPVNCKPHSCYWCQDTNSCRDKECDYSAKVDCLINFNCKWNYTEGECVTRNVIFKKRRRKI
jgi:hypothetical protein